MKLTELNPAWVGYGGPGIRDAEGNEPPRREGIGLRFDCPCGNCETQIFVSFENPFDGRPPHIYRKQNIGYCTPLWHREGETFEALTLVPSIRRNPLLGGCGWHGFITNGEVIND